MLERITLHALWVATAVRILVPSASDPDLWGHVLFGNLLLGGVLPTTNGLAYTVPDHPWVNHELVAEGVMAAVFNLRGAAGLVALKTAVGLATLALVWRAARRRSGERWAASVATAIAALVMAPGLMIRPQLFTLLFLALTLDWLAAADYRARGPARYLPLVVVLWVNTHGGVLAGVGLAAAGVLAALAGRAALAGGPQRSDAQRSDAPPLELGATGLLLLALGAALLLNPYGTSLLGFLLTGVTPRVPITEWAPVALGDRSFLAFKALGVVAGAWLALSGRGRVPETVIVAAAAAAAVLHRRHIPLFAIAAAPVVAACLADTVDRLRRRSDLVRTVPLLRAAIGAAAALQVALAVAAALRAGGRIEVDARTYPIQAVRFLSQNAIGGNVALPFDWGEFALWSLPPGSRVAIDGRFTTAYPQPLLDQAWRFMTGAPGWDDLLTRYPTDIVLADRTQAPARLLRGHPDWEYVYSDPVSVVFLRRVPSQAAALARFDAGALIYDRTPLDRDFPALARAASGAGSEHPAADAGARILHGVAAGAPGPRPAAASATLEHAWTDP